MIKEGILEHLQSYLDNKINLIEIAETVRCDPGYVKSVIDRNLYKGKNIKLNCSLHIDELKISNNEFWGSTNDITVGNCTKEQLKLYI
jgi:hypothetical protein